VCRGRFDEDAGAQSSEASLEVMDAQWRAYVEQLRGSGQLSSAMAIADVSGSMNGQPLLVRARMLWLPRAFKKFQRNIRAWRAL
jgi:hypothetical protein